MNLTVLSLSVGKALNFNTFSFSRSLFSSVIQFNKINVGFSFNQFLKSNSNKASISVSDSSFNNFLSRVITIENKIEKSHLIYTFNPFNLTNTQFKNITNYGSIGGAVMSFAPALVRHCIFDRCAAKIGGGISQHNFYDQAFTTFKLCSSTKDTGSLHIIAKMKADIIVNQTLFLSSRSDFFGSMYKYTKGTLTMECSNITNSKADSCVGAFEFTDGELITRYLTIARSKCGAHNGAGVIRGNDAVSIEKTVFYVCQHSSTIADAGSALLLYDTTFNSYISDSYFIKNSLNHGSFTLSKSGGMKVDVSSCCFTGPKESEIKNCGECFSVNKCSFLSTCDYIFPEFSVGYQMRIEKVENQGDESFINSIKSMSVCLVIALGCAIVFTFLHYRISLMISRVMKPERTII